MRLLPTAEQIELAEVLDNALAKASGAESGPGTQAVATVFSQLGLLVPDAAWSDTPELTAAELVAVFEQLGRRAACGPWVEVFAFLPPVLSGLPTSAQREIGAYQVGDGLPAVGLQEWHELAEVADHAAVRLLLADGMLWLAATGASRRTIDPTVRLFELVPTVELGAVDSEVRDRAFNRAVLAVAAQTLGVVERMHALTVSYIQEREQFGRPLAQFQAVRHKAADQRVTIDLLRPLVYGAAVAIDANAHDADRAASAARVSAATSARSIALSATHLHGAIGYTAEYELSRLLLRAEALRFSWGRPAQHRARILESLMVELRGSRAND